MAFTSTSARTSGRSAQDHARISAHSGLGSLSTLSAPLKVVDENYKTRPHVAREYPAPPLSGGAVEEKYGITIHDPWRELETLESPITQGYIQAQNNLSKPILHSHPLRAELEQAVEKSYAHPRTSCPHLQRDGWYYWLHNPGTAARDVLVRSRSLEDFGKTAGDGPGGVEVVFDLNGETNMSLYMWSFSPSGWYWNAILQESGSDWQRIRTVDTETKEVVEADLTQGKFTFGATWIGDKGFLYKRVIDTAANFAAADGQFGYYYHRLNTPQTDDVLVWLGSGPNATMQIVGRPKVMSCDETGTSGQRAWLFFDIYRNTNPETECFVVPLPPDFAARDDMGAVIKASVGSERKWLARGYTGETNYTGTLTDGTHIFFSTADDHPTGRVIALASADIDNTPINGDLPTYELVPQNPDGVLLQSIHLVNDSTLILVYLRDACASVVFADAHTGLPIGATTPTGTKGHAHAVDTLDIPVPPAELNHAKDHTPAASVIPKHASISAISSRSDSPFFFFTVDTFVSPPYVLEGTLEAGSGGVPEIALTRLGHESAPIDDLVCDQVFYDSHDGVKVPLFICHRADLDMSKPQKTLLYAYGGSGICITPTHEPLFEAFMRDLNGVLAVACIRGGGEYGAAWHKAAMGKNRYVGWDDLAWAAKYLQAEGISQPSSTATYGISNGGTLVSACVNRHPELYGAVMADVGVIDLTRFHLFTLGRYWTAELGSPDDPDVLPTIYATSPLHNVNTDPEVVYPAVLVTTGDHDTRVIPGHSLKYLAELQFIKKENPNIFLGRIYENVGHEAGSKSIAQKVEEAADRLVFLSAHLRC